VIFDSALPQGASTTPPGPNRTRKRTSSPISAASGAVCIRWRAADDLLSAAIDHASQRLGFDPDDADRPPVLSSMIFAMALFMRDGEEIE